MGSIQKEFTDIDVVHPFDPIDKETTLQLSSNLYVR
jgi:hypothetical protein